MERLIVQHTKTPQKSSDQRRIVKWWLFSDQIDDKANEPNTNAQYPLEEETITGIKLLHGDKVRSKEEHCYECTNVTNHLTRPLVSSSATTATLTTMAVVYTAITCGNRKRERGERK